MFLRRLGLVLVLSYLTELDAQDPCPAPELERGFLVPELRAYLHGSSLAYACSAGWKPAAEGWWATSVCVNGLWSHPPQCIDENACFTPVIPNGKYNESPEGLWYKEGSVIRIKCDEGYKHQAWGATATCRKGTWSALPLCQRSETSCNEPPNIPHAVILHKYQDIFAADSEVHFECEDGYGVGANARKSVFCVAGTWTKAPSCVPKAAPGEDGDTSGGVTKPVDESRGSGRGPTTTGANTGATTSDGSTAIETVAHCGPYPKVVNGDVVREKARSLRYACNGFYKRVGPETVVCFRNGTWSEAPTCKEAFCQINLDEYTNYNFQESGTIILKERESKKVQCIWPDYSSQITCTRGKVRVTQCCHYQDHYYQRCN